MTMTTPGTVTLVGGGPGDPDLLTVAAVRALEAADVVLYDRLAPHDTLAGLAPRAELIDVGKRPGHHPIPQEEIERLLVAHALAGSAVVRLKGGDPFVFGRGGEETEACRRAGVPVRVVPGVTSAIAVPAAAGIPVTHRNISRLFTVVSGHAPLSPAELEHLAGLGGTIVILMGVTNLPPSRRDSAGSGWTRTCPSPSWSGDGRLASGPRSASCPRSSPSPRAPVSARPPSSSSARSSAWRVAGTRMRPRR
ncbi:uroporphyrinogen-III C-methyltransferase [Leifsonia xyli]|uniref:uroporphyrinogen-III C-methyltransferase n=1 Tax=Leifsonia xyli TaxID=1575 RepID=UPI003D67C2EA